MCLLEVWATVLAAQHTPGQGPCAQLEWGRASSCPLCTSLPQGPSASPALLSLQGHL